MIRFTVPGIPVAKGRARIGRTRNGHAVAFTAACFGALFAEVEIRMRETGL